MKTWERDYDRSLEAPEELAPLICPECGCEYERGFTKDGRVIGCEHCIAEICAYDEFYRERYGA